VNSKQIDLKTDDEIRVVVYVDGFNFYYQINSASYPPVGHKWIDLRALSLNILTNKVSVGEKRIASIKISYFTAHIAASGDNERPERQNVYLRALKKHLQDDIEIVKGRFVTLKKKMPLADNPDEKVRVIHNEEKMSDVNLATALVSDTYENNYDLAVVISNDSDLKAPIKLAASKGKFIVHAFASSRNANKSLSQVASKSVNFSKADLQKSELPEVVGKLTKPLKWREEG